jgi:cysteine desulfurase
MQVYLDNNSTTACASEVVAEMLPYFTKDYGNAASTHPAGRVATTAIARAREHVARAIGASAESIIFTSGATEANNLALLGLARGNHCRRKIVVSAVEHKSVLAPALHLADHAYTVDTLPVDRNGVVDLNAARRLIDETTLVVSVQGANNETGTIQPIREIARIAHERGALCHCDAAQMLGKIPVNVRGLEVDLASFSAHKVYGPKGIGALFLASGKIVSVVQPILYGGGHERDLRPGTQNVPAIVGFGSACRSACAMLPSEMERILALRQLLEHGLLTDIPELRVNSVDAPRIPGTISLTVSGVPADMLMSNLNTVCISNGSACNSGAPEPSHVLLAMKLTRSEAECTVRISLGRYTTEADIAVARQEIVAAATRLKAELGIQAVILQPVRGGQ